MTEIRNRLTFANVVSCTALAISLGGVSYAAVKLPAASVGSRQLRPKAVTAPKLHPGSVTTSALAAGAVLNSSLAPVSVTSDKLAFPLFVRQAISQTEVVAKSSGNCPASCPPPPNVEVVTLNVSLPAPASVFVSANAVVRNVSNEPATVYLTPPGRALVPGGKSIEFVGPNATVTVPAQSVVQLPAGDHKLPLYVASLGLWTDHVEVEAQIAALALPSA